MDDRIVLLEKRVDGVVYQLIAREIPVSNFGSGASTIEQACTVIARPAKR